MRRFHFRLESILELREKQADQKRLELGAITQQCEALEREIEAHTALRRRTLTDHGLTSLADIAYRRAVEAYAARLQVEMARLREELHGAEQKRDEVAEEYREARRKAEVLEKLRDRRKESHAELVKREEQLRLDEISQRMMWSGTQ
ncbi:MAG TPA: flagellar export protein FliJ [Alkalispirochaeta sp.]|nr:flagellar export protein FliJ [Alkalispirochaeta sp.]